MKCNAKNYHLFRFKTLQEFGGVRPYDWESEGRMDYLYGTPVRRCKKIKFYEEWFTIDREDGSNDIWYLLYSDVVLSPASTTETEE